MTTKKCKQCGETKELDRFAVWGYKGGKTPSYESVCKACKEAAQAATKLCSQCDEEKPVTEFEIRAYRRGMTGDIPVYVDTCNDCL